MFSAIGAAVRYVFWKMINALSAIGGDEFQTLIDEFGTINWFQDLTTVLWFLQVVNHVFPLDWAAGAIYSYFLIWVVFVIAKITLKLVPTIG